VVLGHHLPGLQYPGQFYRLYLIEDLFSRKIVGWEVHAEESAAHASRLIERACLAEGVHRPGLVLHSDNGSPMKGATMLSTLQRLGVVPSFSRPSVSDDNPYAESLFRTLKYTPAFPNQPFASLADARAWVARFVHWYNEEHRHLSRGDVQGREQGRRAMAHVVMRAPFGHPRGQGQDRLRPVERLNLALLVHAQHHRLHRRVQIQPDNVARLRHKQRIARELERLLPVRLQTEGTPDAADGRLRQSRLLGHRARAPVRGVFRLHFQGARDDRFHIGIVHRARRPGSRRIAQTAQTLADETPTPLRNGLRGHRQFLGHNAIIQPLGTGQNDPRAQRQRLRRLAPARPSLQLLAFRCGQNQVRLGSTSHRFPLASSAIYL
jgi:hypothetical protein